jgi:hypothetical protein
MVVAAYGSSTLVVVSGIAIGMALPRRCVALPTQPPNVGTPAAAGIAVINSLANLWLLCPDIIGNFAPRMADSGGLLAIAATVA